VRKKKKKKEKRALTHIANHRSAEQSELSAIRSRSSTADVNSIYHDIYIYIYIYIYI